jgi:hypothetical protein
MHRGILPEEVLEYRLTTARQKKRRQKKDFEKGLIRLNKRHNLLFKERFSQPMVPLKKPYQKGWKRFFVLTEETSRRPEAGFYRTLLEKINTVNYSSDKKFGFRHFRKTKKVHGVKPQYLQEYDEQGWKYHSSLFTEQEKQLFYIKTSWSNKSRAASIRYVFGEPWRFKLLIKPNIITEVRMRDALLEQAYQQLENHITSNDLLSKMIKIDKGESYRWVNYMYRMLKTGMPAGKQPLHLLINQCNEQKI